MKTFSLSSDSEQMFDCDAAESTLRLDINQVAQVFLAPALADGAPAAFALFSILKPVDVPLRLDRDHIETAGNGSLFLRQCRAV